MFFFFFFIVVVLLFQGNIKWTCTNNHTEEVCVFDRVCSWGENLIILVNYFTYPVNPFIARSGISQLREFP